MEEIVRAKFYQNPQLAEKLIATADRKIVEGNTWHDTFWGVDAATGKGENHLGVILMKIREELINGMKEEHVYAGWYEQLIDDSGAIIDRTQE